jgi:hypothetical protein
VLARVFEEAGLSTVSLSMVREHTARVRPPRALFVPFPFGFALGKPGDPALQHRVLAAALALLERPAGPVLEDFPEDEAPERLPQASGLSLGPAPADEPADELTALRPFYERWLEAHDGRTAVGISGIRQRRWRGVVRLLEAYARGEESDLPERSLDMPLPQFIRYCVDDLKAFYFEARMAQRGDVSEAELHTWFWTETAMGRLVPRVAQRMGALDDPAAKAIAYGIAR